MEFYIYPPIAPNDEYRLGQIIRNKADKSYRAILTPHCHLAVQADAKEPRAEYVLTIKTVDAKAEIERKNKRPWTEKDRNDEIRRRIQSPAGSMGQPAGRYWFLPSFFEMPDLFCDFMQMETIPMKSLIQDYDKYAVLDSPYAEALQSCFLVFYSSVGLPNLHPEKFIHFSQTAAAPAARPAS